jgi:hypothetical protein
MAAIVFVADAGRVVAFMRPAIRRSVDEIELHSTASTAISARVISMMAWPMSCGPCGSSAASARR